jgi:hypothetical protein
MEEGNTAEFKGELDLLEEDNRKLFEEAKYLIGDNFLIPISKIIYIEKMEDDK